MSGVIASIDSFVAETVAAGWEPYTVLLNASRDKKLGFARCCFNCVFTRCFRRFNSSPGKVGFSRRSFVKANHCSKLSLNPEALITVAGSPKGADAEIDAPRWSICSAICMLLLVFVPYLSICEVMPDKPGM